MALNGFFYGSTNNQFIKPKITWQAVQSQEGNYSDITATLFYSRTNTGYTTYGTWQGSLQIGQEEKKDSRVITIGYNSDTFAITHTARVFHDSYGEAKVVIQAQGSISGTSLESTFVSEEIILDNIARESTLGASDGYIGSTVTLSVRQRNPEYSHSIFWEFGSLQGYISKDWGIAQEEEKLTDTSIAFLLPESFYYEIIDTASGQCHLTIRTFANDTQIGVDKTCSFTVFAKEENCGPVVSGEVRDINEKTLALTGDDKVFIKGVSTALCTIQAQTRLGATPHSLKIAGRPALENSLEIPEFEEEQVTFSVVDSRGFATEHIAPVALIPYKKPSMVASCQRTDPTSGNATLTVEGKCFRGSFGKADNTLTVSCQVDFGEAQEFTPELTEEGYRLMVGLSGLAYTASHKVTVTVQDRLFSLTQNLTVSKGVPVFHWGESDFAFSVPVYAEGGIVVAGKALWEHIYPVGSIYMSTKEDSPQELFGGRWERLKDRFLLAAGEEYAPGSVGGEATHVLTEAELPSHSHGQNGWALGVTSTAYPDAFALAKPWDVHNNFQEDGSQSIQYTGQGKAHNNMPPYLAVYMWKRTA